MQEKAAVRRRIAERRTQCAAGLRTVLRPLAWIDRARAFWQQVAPIVKAAVPASRSSEGRPAGWFRTFWRWAPVATSLWRSFRARHDAGEAPP